MRPIEITMMRRSEEMHELAEAMDWLQVTTIDQILTKGNDHLGGKPFRSGGELRRTPQDRIIKAGCRDVDEYIDLCYNIGLDLLRIEAGLPARTVSLQ